MPRLIESPTVVRAAGNLPKRIEEYAGRVNTGHEDLSVARMVSPQGWVEPGQRPEFREFTLVLRGLLRVEHAAGAVDVRAGQAVVAEPGEWIRYSSPEPGGAEYIAVCMPAFGPDTVHRDPACPPRAPVTSASGGGPAAPTRRRGERGTGGRETRRGTRPPSA